VGVSVSIEVRLSPSVVPVSSVGEEGVSSDANGDSISLHPAPASTASKTMVEQRPAKEQARIMVDEFPIKIRWWSRASGDESARGTAAPGGSSSERS
jgi:hypothetical protein